jgi:hypothetical protein
LDVGSVRRKGIRLGNCAKAVITSAGKPEAVNALQDHADAS